MVEITCDNCSAKKPDKLASGIEWILGYDLELEGPNALQRSIRILEHWDDRRVTEFGAIHLCSAQCRDRYLANSEESMSLAEAAAFRSIRRGSGHGDTRGSLETGRIRSHRQSPHAHRTAFCCRASGHRLISAESSHECC